MISLTYTVMYWIMWQQAIDLDESAAGKDWDSAGDTDVSLYDSCGGMGVQTNSFGQESTFETKWTVIFALNAMTYLLTTIFTILGCVGMFSCPLAFCSCCGLIALMTV